MNPRRSPFLLPFVAGAFCATLAGASAPATAPTSGPAERVDGSVVEPATQWLADPSHDVASLAGQAWAFAPLDKQAAARSRRLLVDAYAAEVRRRDAADFQRD